MPLRPGSRQRDRQVTASVSRHGRNVDTRRTSWSRHDMQSLPSSYPALANLHHTSELLLHILLWHCWLGVRKSIRPVEIERRVFVWLSVCSEVQTDRIWSSWCHRHPQTSSSLASLKSRLVLPFWYQPTQVVLEKRPLNGCSSSSSSIIHLEYPEDIHHIAHHYHIHRCVPCKDRQGN